LYQTIKTKGNNMGFFEKLLTGSKSSSLTTGVIDYGKSKKGGGHNHIYNTGDDQTAAQKAGHIQAKKTKEGKK
jgi:hypothetical protein